MAFWTLPTLLFGKMYNFDVVEILVPILRKLHLYMCLRIEYPRQRHNLTPILLSQVTFQNLEIFGHVRAVGIGSVEEYLIAFKAPHEGFVPGEVEYPAHLSHTSAPKEGAGVEMVPLSVVVIQGARHSISGFVKDVAPQEIIKGSHDEGIGI